VVVTVDTASADVGVEEVVGVGVDEVVDTRFGCVATTAADVDVCSGRKAGLLSVIVTVGPSLPKGALKPSPSS